MEELLPFGMYDNWLLQCPTVKHIDKEPPFMRRSIPSLEMALCGLIPSEPQQQM